MTKSRDDKSELLGENSTFWTYVYTVNKGSYGFNAYNVCLPSVRP